MHLRHPGLADSACEKKESENLKKPEIQDIFIKTNLINLVFNMTWLMKILKTYLEDQLLIRCYVVKHLILLKVLATMEINVDLLKWFIRFLIKRLQVMLLKMKSCKIMN